METKLDNAKVVVLDSKLERVKVDLLGHVLENVWEH